VIKGFMIQAAIRSAKAPVVQVINSKTNFSPDFTSLRQEFWPWQMQDPRPTAANSLSPSRPLLGSTANTRFWRVVDGMPVVEKSA